MIWVLACVENGAETLPAPDRDLFEAEVEPVLEARCASPSCHGDAARPLEIFAPGLHRLDPAENWLPGTLTAEEVEQNYQRARAFVEPPLLLQKPSEQLRHAGGRVFEDESAWGYEEIERWLDS